MRSIIFNAECHYIYRHNSINNALQSTMIKVGLMIFLAGIIYHINIVLSIEQCDWSIFMATVS